MKTINQILLKMDLESPSLSDAQSKRTSFSVLAIANAVLAFILYIAFLIVDSFLDKTFMAASVELSLKMLDFNVFFNGWFWIFSLPVYYMINTFIYVFPHYMKEKHKALKIFFVVLFHSVLSESIKLINKDTRPCFESDLIGREGCSCSFGKYSGHSSGSTLFYLLVFSEIVAPMKIARWAKGLILGGLIFVVLNVALSRIYFGAHSFNQVILGILFGYAIFALCLVFRGQIDYFFARLANYPEEEGRTLSPNVLNIIKGLLLLLYIGLNLLLIFTWAYNVNNFEGIGDKKISDSFCGQKCGRESEFLSNSHLSSGAFSQAVTFLLVYLLILSPRQTERAGEDYHRQTFQGFWFALKRFLIVALVSLPVGTAFIVTSLLDGLAAYFLICLSLSFYAPAILLVRPWLLKRAGLVVPGDLYAGPKKAKENVVENKREFFEMERLGSDRMRGESKIEASDR